MFLKIGSRSPKFNQDFSHANYTIHKVWFEPSINSQDKVQTSIYGPLDNAPVTLKIGSRSPKSKHSFLLSQWCIHVSLVRIHPSVRSQDRVQTRSFAKANADRIRTKTNMSPSTAVVGTGDIISGQSKIDSGWNKRSRRIIALTYDL